LNNKFSPAARQDREEPSLTARAEAAARAELRGERSGILGAVGPAAALTVTRARRVPDRWSLLQVIGYGSILLNFAIHGSVPGIAPVQMPNVSVSPQK
jgi:hypothetical protein